LSKQYQIFKIKRFKLTYQPVVPTLMAGALTVFATNDLSYDSTIVGTDEISHATANGSWTSTSVWEPTELEFKPANKISKFSTTADDAQFNCQGFVKVIAASDIDLTTYPTLGLLYADVDAEFSIPMVSQSVAMRETFNNQIESGAVMGAIFDYRAVCAVLDPAVAGGTSSPPVAGVLGMNIAFPLEVSSCFELPDYILQMQMSPVVNSPAGTIGPTWSTYISERSTASSFEDGQVLWVRFVSETSGAEAGNIVCVFYTNYLAASGAALDGISTYTGDGDGALQWLGQDFTATGAALAPYKGTWLKR
jgi:hypothetical protein